MKSNTSMKIQYQWHYIIMGIASLFAVIIEKEAFGTYFLAFLYGFGLFITGIIFSIRFRMWQPAVVMCWSGLAIWHYFLAARPGVVVRMLNMIGIYDVDSFTVDWLDQNFSLALALAHIGSMVIVGPLYMPVVQRSHQLEKSARKIFKLAAEMVTGTENSFTDRPYVAGHENYQRDELIGFGRYLKAKNIALYDIKADVFKIGLSMGRSPYSDKSFQLISSISFANDGKLTVKISENDYKKYRNSLTFNQLCDSLAKVFGRFIEYYKDGNEERIIVELKSV